MADSRNEQISVSRAEIDAIVVDTLQQLNGVYVDLGYSEESSQREFKQLVEDAREFFKSKLLPKLALREKLEKEISELVKSLEGFLNELGNPKNETERLQDIIKLPLHQQKEQLLTLRKDLEKLREERIASLQVLHEKLHNLYKALIVTPNPNFAEIGQPTMSRVLEYEGEIKSLEQELDKIKNTIDKYRAEIIEIWKEIDGKNTKHDSELELYIINPQNSTMKTSRDTFGKVEELHTRLTQERDKRTTLKQQYLTGIKQLYIDLQIPENEEKRAAFEKQDINGINDTVMDILKTEHDRLYAVKKEKFKSLIAKSKAKLEHLWKELHFSDEQREQFYNKTKGSGDYEDAYNDERLLELMDAEIIKLEKLLAAIGDILKMIVRREWIKSEMHKFEKTASDKNRLFGSSLKLLEEEKFRKIVAKEFPKLTDDLRKKIGEFEKNNNGERLLFQGHPYLDTMNAEKENPNFKLMHLRLLLNGSDTAITESDITMSVPSSAEEKKEDNNKTPRNEKKDKKVEKKEDNKTPRETAFSPAARPATARTSKQSTPVTLTRPSTATPKLTSSSSGKKKPPGTAEKENK